jgi:hypothetical protein
MYKINPGCLSNRDLYFLVFILTFTTFITLPTFPPHSSPLFTITIKMPNTRNAQPVKILILNFSASVIKYPPNKITDNMIKNNPMIKLSSVNRLDIACLLEEDDV